MTTLRLVLGDQLNPCHSWFAAPDPDVLHVIMEIREETEYVLHHAQKIIAIFAAPALRSAAPVLLILTFTGGKGWPPPAPGPGFSRCMASAGTSP